MRECCMLLMDATPIIFLAKLRRLELLLEFNLPIFMPREVEFEVIEKQALLERRPKNDEELLINAFLRKYEALEQLTVVRTFVCDAAEANRKKDTAYKSNGDGEVAANSLFLNRDKYGVNGPALLLYEDADVEVVFRRNDVHFLTTYAMLVAMEKLGCIDSADKEWDALSEIYSQKNQQPLEKHFTDRSNRGDTEHKSKMRPK